MHVVVANLYGGVTNLAREHLPAMPFGRTFSVNWLGRTLAPGALRRGPSNRPDHSGRIE